MDVLDKFMQAESFFTKSSSEDLFESEDIVMVVNHSEKLTSKRKVATRFNTFLKDYFKCIQAQNVKLDLALCTDTDNVGTNLNELITSSFDVVRQYYGVNIFNNACIRLELKEDEVNLLFHFDNNWIQNRLLNKTYKNSFAAWKMINRNGDFMVVANLNTKNFLEKKKHIYQRKQGIAYEL